MRCQGSSSGVPTSRSPPGERVEIPYEGAPITGCLVSAGAGLASGSTLAGVVHGILLGAVVITLVGALEGFDLRGEVPQ